MIARISFALVALALLAHIFDAPRLPLAAAQDVLPTPVGHLGGREPLPTAPGVPIEPLPSATPSAPDPALVGVWLLTFADAERAPAQLVLDRDGMAAFVDGEGNRGAGVWVASGPRRGVLAVAMHAADRAATSPGITVLQGALEIAEGEDAAALEYTLMMVDASGAPAERSGPFLADARRVGEA